MFDDHCIFVCAPSFAASSFGHFPLSLVLLAIHFLMSCCIFVKHASCSMFVSLLTITHVTHGRFIASVSSTAARQHALSNPSHCPWRSPPVRLWGATATRNQKHSKSIFNVQALSTTARQIWPSHAIAVLARSAQCQSQGHGHVPIRYSHRQQRNTGKG